MLISNSSLKIIPNNRGLLRKVLNKNDDNFFGFGEAYISEINLNQIKGWKKHSNKISNFIVVHGRVQFVVCSQEKPTIFQSFILDICSNSNKFTRLCIGEDMWFAFKGLGDPVSRVLNISNICNEDVVSENLDLNSINYTWDKK
tara:strand:+ start:81 stop:512 length:432 start_codon:yes stop_codon:yes gene_type:complete